MQIFYIRFGKQIRIIPQRGFAMKYIYGAFSDIGSFRPNNEDSFFAGRCSTDIPIYIGIVCDGIGGMKNGEVASGAITEHISEWSAGLDLNITFEQAAMSFLDNIYSVNQKICCHCKVNSIETGSTMSAVIVSEGRFMAANVGDSRIYHISDDIVQITEDDVVPANGKKRSALRQCVGFNEKLFINTYYGRIEKKESILICSDGFYKRMDGKRIIKKCRSLHSYSNISKVIQKETERLKCSGERDNITAYIIKNI